MWPFSIFPGDESTCRQLRLASAVGRYGNIDSKSATGTVPEKVVGERGRSITTQSNVSVPTCNPTHLWNHNEQEYPQLDDGGQARRTALFVKCSKCIRDHRKGLIIGFRIASVNEIHNIPPLYLCTIKCANCVLQL